ncbi:hypothetical protein [Bacterioplanoides pacificum]|uniref:ATP-binding protein n=1 Tax=Bacterioplanoides pacificum TaxID=1171596 RepID=A0ABV7VQR7_9GAMM
MASKSNNRKTDSSELVRYSRAGDTFHYRWAARRCLRLLDFNSDLTHITIEGSKEAKLGGEYVIDTAEYSSDNGKGSSVAYFQLKHSTTRCNENFTLSGLKETIIGFSNRYKDLQEKNHSFTSIQFLIITNRPISPRFKESINKLARGESGGKSFDDTIKAYSKLTGKKLQEFCGLLKLVDGEGNYDAQKHALHREIANLACDSSDVSQMLKLVELVRERIEPGAKKQEIDRNDVLEQFGLTSEKDLFPAPPLFEKLPSIIEREQYDSLYKEIVDSTSPFTILSAVGGTGKSITCNHLVDRFVNGSLAIAYDCFGNGGYRRLSGHRHRTYDAYIQVANELAQKGLCEPIIPSSRNHDDRLTKLFLSRLSQSIEKLKERNENALLIILFDAVDNAEMAATEFGDRCFASHLLKENIPDGCRVVYLSRPERIKLFSPSEKIPQIEIKPFSDNETLFHLKTKYPEATLENAVEYRRLTNGNPRVQANALALNKNSVDDLLTHFSAREKTVNDLIEDQLNNALTTIKEQYPNSFRTHVEDICTGLATLPPFVPVEVLAAAAEVSVSAVKSFISDLGRPLWLTDNYVQFRDEPTESWFVSTFSAKKRQIKAYISRLKPLAGKFSYVAEALPSLLLKAGQYKEIIRLALSEDMLPTDNPVESRSIQVYRLQFAFKAALKNKKYLDACKLALRAGEEVSGTDRQIELLTKNIDLATQYLSPQRIMDLAHQREMSGEWNGSETLYSSALLAPMPECEGEARSYLRSGWHWLTRYIEDRDSRDERSHYRDSIKDIDILVMFYSCFYLDGYKAAIDFILRCKPPELIFRIVSDFSSRMVDKAEYEVLELMAHYGKNCPPLVLAITHELLKIGRIPDKKCITRALNKIVGPGKWLIKPKGGFDNHNISTSAYLSLLEASIIHKLPLKNIKRALNYYIDGPRAYSINSDWDGSSRSCFMRSISIRACINNSFDFSVESVIPKSWYLDSNDYHDREEVKGAKEAISILLPWYLIRARLLSGNRISIEDWHQKAKEGSSRLLRSRYKTYDPLPFEITTARFFNLAISQTNVDKELDDIASGINDNSISFRYPDKVNALRIANRQIRLTRISDILEESCYKTAKIVDEEESPIDHANNFINLSRAVLSISKADAEIYFEEAIAAVSRFGDEAYERWMAVNSIAKRSAEKLTNRSKHAYRYMRCAELIGDTIGREKKWDRDGAMETCFHLSPESAFAIASRWKDRDVGRSGRMLASLLQTAVVENAISPSAAWSLSVLPFDYDLSIFAEQCIEREYDESRRKIIFDSLISDFRKKGITGKPWKKMSEISEKYGLFNEVLNDLAILMREKSEGGSETGRNFLIKEPKESDHQIGLYDDINILSDEGLQEVLERFESLDFPKDVDAPWKYAASKLTAGNATKFLFLLANSEFLNAYHIQNAINWIPDRLKRKPSVIKIWPDIIKIIAKRFPEEFTRWYSRDRILGEIGSDVTTVNAIREGVLEGLSESNGLESASTFFGFVDYYVNSLSSSDAAKLLDYALTRFELHINDGYSDGNWSSSLEPPENIVQSFTGYLWAALGSPRASEHWCAMHAVRRLYQLRCEEELDALLEWMISDSAGSFIYKGYPFYNMHAKQHLLMALARCAIEDPSVIVGKHKIFSNIALNEQHILIQKYAADIARSIAKIFPSAHTEKVLVQLEEIEKSPFQIEYSDNYNEKRDTPWHKDKSIALDTGLYFAHDFDRYWFEPLGEVFKVPGSQVEDLAADVIMNDWKLPVSERFIRDPRQDIWNSYRDQSTYHSHSGYPKTATYSFYLSYHSMMVAAAKLLNAMPTFHSRDWHENQWEDWLHRHLLTRKDQYWLSDTRGFIPAHRRAWTDDKTDKDWRWQVLPRDFLEVLLLQREKDTWLNVAGSWDEYYNGHNEHISVSSRLVPSWASSSLQRAMTQYRSHWPGTSSLDAFSGQEENDNCNGNPFRLSCWYSNAYQDNGVDELDPYAGCIGYPPCTIHQDVMSQLDIYSDNESCQWIDSNGAVIAHGQIWSEDKPLREDEEYCCRGNRLQASLSFLKKMCKKLDVDLAIQVDIKRDLVGIHRDRNDDIGYLPPYRKIFILSRNGVLKDTSTTFRLREQVSEEL